MATIGNLTNNEQSLSVRSARNKLNSAIAEANKVSNKANLSDFTKAETNLTLSGAVSIDITTKKSYIYNLTSNVDLTIDTTNVGNNESYVIETVITTQNGTETLTLQNSTDTKYIVGEYNASTGVFLSISVTKDGSGNVYIKYAFSPIN